MKQYIIINSSPLNLEELKTMIGKPIYMENFDKRFIDGWHVLKKITDDEIIFIWEGSLDSYVKIKSIGIDFNLYAYPPAVLPKLPIDAKPIVHGKVTHITYDMPYCEYGICNVCGAYIQAWNYCPNCGAKMDL